MSIDNEIEESMRLAAEQQALETGTRLVDEQEASEQAVFDRARKAQEEELGGLPEKYRGKTAAEVFALMQKEAEYKASKSSEDDQEDASDSDEDESPAPEESDAVTALREASEAFYANDGQLDAETVAKLESLPSADLIKAWQALQAEAPKAEPLSEADAEAIVKEVGGQEAYNLALRWAADNLSEDDKASYDAVVQSGNKAATKFAVEALQARYKAAVGFDGDPGSGTNVKTPSVKPYKSEAQLRKDLSNPRYQEDPAFRLEVEDRLRVSGDLLQ